MDISGYKPQTLEAHMNYDAEPVYKRVLLLHEKQGGEEGVRTVMEVIWKAEVCEAFVRISTVYENKILMMLNFEEISAWASKWDDMQRTLVNNEFMFNEKTIYKSDTGFVLSLNSVLNPKNKKQRFIKLQKQSFVSKLLFRSEQSVGLSEAEILALPNTVLEDLAVMVGKLNKNGSDALKTMEYKMWARQNPRKESPYYLPADITAGGGYDREVDSRHPLANTLKRKRTE